MLFLLSIGLHDERDMSIKALNIARKCDEIYVEFYTNRMATNVEKLERLIGKPVHEVERSDLEEKSVFLLERARKKDIAILVGGDVLSATTHISLLLEAKKMGIKTKVIHGSSIFTAVAETGLQLYKFGRTVTLTKELHKSFYDAVLQNKKAGLHTLILIDPELSVSKALEILSEHEEKWKQGLFSADSKLLVACDLGGESIIKYGFLKDLKKFKFKEPAVFILPCNLHFLEKEFLEILEGKTKYQ